MHNAEKCASCDGNYHLSNDQCVANTCTCSNGQHAANSLCTVHNAEKCASCDGNYHLSNDQCVANTCTCSNGQHAANSLCTVHNAEKCASCYANYHLSGDQCVEVWRQRHRTRAHSRHTPSCATSTASSHNPATLRTPYLGKRFPNRGGSKQPVRTRLATKSAELWGRRATQLRWQRCTLKLGLWRSWLWSVGLPSANAKESALTQDFLQHTYLTDIRQVSAPGWHQAQSPIVVLPMAPKAGHMHTTLSAIATLSSVFPMVV